MTNVNATAGTGSAALTWTAPASGGQPTSYKITPFIGSAAQTSTTITGSPPATSTTINGLTGGSTYTFTVQAINRSGQRPGLGALQRGDAELADGADDAHERDRGRRLELGPW